MVSRNHLPHGGLAGDEKCADFEGVKVRYYDVGKGSTALVFVHGWTCNAGFWKQSIDRFPRHRTIAVDLPGHGKSDKPRTAYTMDFFARSLDAVMTDACVDSAVLVGHSMGTPVIRQFYRRYPRRTRGLVIVDGRLRIPDVEELDNFLIALRDDYIGNATRCVDAMLLPLQDPGLKREIRAAMLATADYVGLSAAQGMADKAIWAQDEIAVPVLAILAESTSWHSDEEQFYRSIASNLDIRFWQKASHFLMLEHPAAFNELVGGFIAKNALL